jgi:putative toxin-antitoxin system antitoxin component (TIGR02293 family)
MNTNQGSIPLSADPLSYLKDVLSLSVQERKQVTSTLDLIPLSKTGLPVSALKHLQDKLRISHREMSDLVGMSESTLQRRYRSGKRLSELESQTVLQLAELWSQGAEIFQDEADLRAWLRSENTALGGQSPLELLATPLGRFHVQEVLLRLEWGIYS